MLNLGLNVVFLPLYGFKAAAVTFVVSELFWLLLAVEASRRVLGFLPDLRYAAVVALAAASHGGRDCGDTGPSTPRRELSRRSPTRAVLVAVPGTVRELIGQLTGDRLKVARGGVA